METEVNSVGRVSPLSDEEAERILENWREEQTHWQPIETAPTDGSSFDAWCVAPGKSGGGVRLCAVRMRGDGSGFGFIVHLREGAYWQYLDARKSDSIYPAWVPTHWRRAPVPPCVQRSE